MKCFHISFTTLNKNIHLCPAFHKFTRFLKCTHTAMSTANISVTAVASFLSPVFPASRLLLLTQLRLVALPDDVCTSNDVLTGDAFTGLRWNRFYFCAHPPPIQCQNWGHFRGHLVFRSFCILSLKCKFEKQSCKADLSHDFLSAEIHFSVQF